MASDYIFNEKRNIEEMINNKTVDKNTVWNLAKYNRFVGGLSDDESYQQIVIYMRENSTEFSEVGMFDAIEKSIASSKKSTMRNVDYVPITDNELMHIKALNDVRLEKLAFVLLADVKYNMACSEQNYTKSFLWFRELYKLARVTMPQNDRGKFLHNLVKAGYISCSLNPNKWWVDVSPMLAEGEVELKLYESNYKELAFTYLNWRNGGYKECKMCHRLFKKNKNTQYCPMCSKQKKQKKIKVVKCEECGDDFEVTGNSKTNKCPFCYGEYRKKYKNDWSSKK